MTTSFEYFSPFVSRRESWVCRIICAHLKSINIDTEAGMDVPRGLSLTAEGRERCDDLMLYFVRESSHS